MINEYPQEVGPRLVVIVARLDDEPFLECRSGPSLSPLSSHSLMITQWPLLEIWSNVVADDQAYPDELGGFLHHSNDKLDSFDDFGQPLTAV